MVGHYTNRKENASSLLSPSRRVLESQEKQGNSRFISQPCTSTIYIYISGYAFEISGYLDLNKRTLDRRRVSMQTIHA